MDVTLLLKLKGKMRRGVVSLSPYIMDGWLRVTPVHIGHFQESGHSIISCRYVFAPFL